MKSIITLTTLFLITATTLLAHDVVLEQEDLSTSDNALKYFILGFKHILPLGLDHILFIISLYIAYPNFKSVIKQATAFTIAHTITLSLSSYNVITIPSYIIEPIIALSIAYIAVENIFTKQLKASRFGVVFIFGLIHGLGFASALSEIGLPQNSFLVSLLCFNIGVEVGQLTIILLLFLVIVKWFAKKDYYKKRIVIPISIATIIMAIYWAAERLV